MELNSDNWKIMKKLKIKHKNVLTNTAGICIIQLTKEITQNTKESEVQST